MTEKPVEQLAKQLAEEMAFALLQNPKNHVLIEAMLSFFECTGIGHDGNVSGGVPELTVTIHGEQHEYKTEGESQLSVLKNVFSEIYYLPLLKKLE